MRFENNSARYVGMSLSALIVLVLVIIVQGFLPPFNIAGNVIDNKVIFADGAGASGDLITGTLTIPENVKQGKTFKARLELNVNPSEEIANGILVGAVFDDGLEIISASPTNAVIDRESSTIVWTLPPESQQLSVKLRGNETGNYTARFRWGITDPYYENYTSSIVEVTEAPVSLCEFSDDFSTDDLSEYNIGSWKPEDTPQIMDGALILKGTTGQGYDYVWMSEGYEREDGLTFHFRLRINQNSQAWVGWFAPDNYYSQLYENYYETYGNELYQNLASYFRHYPLYSLVHGFWIRSGMIYVEEKPQSRFTGGYPKYIAVSNADKWYEFKITLNQDGTASYSYRPEGGEWTNIEFVHSAGENILIPGIVYYTPYPRQYVYLDEWNIGDASTCPS